MSLTLTTTPEISKIPTGPPSTADQVSELVPPSGWQMIDLREVWKYRGLLYFFAWRDFKVRYKQTVLGVAWAVLQPTLLTIIFSWVLSGSSNFAGANIPYPLFVLSGLILWNLFATSLASAASSLFTSEHLIAKVYFPRILLPLAAVGPCLVDFAIAGGLTAILLLWYGVAPASTLPLAMLPIMVVIALIVGLGSLLSALNITYRDLRHTTAFMLQAWLFGTPAIFMASLSPASVEVTAPSAMTWFVLANPLNGCILFFRAAVFGLPLPWLLLGLSALTAIVACVIGCLYFHHVEDSLADII